MMGRKINYHSKSGEAIGNISQIISGTGNTTCTEMFKLYVLDIEVNEFESFEEDISLFNYFGDGDSYLKQR
jgi:hypothetical protein